MEASSDEVKENFTPLIIAGLGTIFTFHVTFSEIIYYAYGETLKEPIVIFQIP